MTETMHHKAIWRGKTLAESDRTLEVGGYVYFPRDTVRMDLLEARPGHRAISNARTASNSTTSSTAVRSKRAAWSYEAPKPKMKPVDHWIGFWEDVDIKA